MITHTGDKSYICNEYGKPLLSVKALISTKDFGIKPYECEGYRETLHLIFISFKNSTLKKTHRTEMPSTLRNLRGLQRFLKA